MKALVITTEDIAYVHDFAPPMSESIEKFIGDWTETVRPRGIPGYLMLVDESGLLKHLPCNLARSLLYGTQFHGSPIVGNIVITKDDGRSIRSRLRMRKSRPSFRASICWPGRLVRESGGRMSNEHP